MTRPKVSNLHTHLLGVAREMAGEVMTNRESRPVDKHGREIETAATFDPFAIVDGISDRLGSEAHVPSSFAAKVTAARRSVERNETEAQAKQDSPQVRADVAAALEHIEFLDELRDKGLMSDDDYAASREEAETELSKLTGEN